MEKEKRFAAIDIGSNAVRLLLSTVIKGKDEIFYKKAAFIRMPVRLGESSFMDGEISKEKIEQLEQTIMGFKHLMEAYRPASHRACATSAMREATNSAYICNRIKEKTGIDINIINGKEEADIIFFNSQWEITDKSLPEVFVDVGGGSTEIRIMRKENSLSCSFNIGTIRLLKDMVASSDWDKMKLWVKEQIAPLRITTARASGGNIHKILSLSGNKKARKLSVNQMRKVRKILKSYNLMERITVLGLKPDRADVILPALKIYFFIMKWSNIKTYIVPQMGLADGIIRQLYLSYP